MENQVEINEGDSVTVHAADGAPATEHGYLEGKEVQGTFLDGAGSYGVDVDPSGSVEATGGLKYEKQIKSWLSFSGSGTLDVKLDAVAAVLEFAQGSKYSIVQKLALKLLTMRETK